MVRTTLRVTALVLLLLGLVGCGFPRTDPRPPREPLICFIPEGCTVHHRLVPAGTVVGWTR